MSVPAGDDILIAGIVDVAAVTNWWRCQKVTIATTMSCNTSLLSAIVWAIFTLFTCE